MKQRIFAHTPTHTLSQAFLAAARLPQAWLAALLLWTLLSAGRSLGTPWAQAAGTESLRWATGIGLALTLAWLMRRMKSAGQFLVTLAGAMALAGVLSGETISHSGLVGPYRDHQLYGSALLLLLPFCAALAVTSKSALWRTGALAALALGTLCLILSETRSAWIGLGAAALVFGGLWLSRPDSRPQRWRVVLVPVLLLLAGLAGLWALNGPPEQQVSLSARAATLTALSSDGSWQERGALWRGTGRMIAAHPLLGVGAGRYPGEQWRWTHVGGPLSPAAHPSLSSEAHSFYAQTAAEMGLPGLGLYLAALAAFFAAGVRRLRNSRRHRLSGQSALLLAALSAAAGQSVDALASPSWQFPEVSFFFWAVLGMGLAALRPEEAILASAQIPDPVRRAGQFALSGSLAVVLAAHILPLGLLTPVEAYNHVAAVTFQGATLTQITSGGTITFSLKAKYSDGGTQDVTLDSGGATNQPSSYSCLVAATNSTCTSKFGTGPARNQLIVSGSDVGKQLKITGSFVDVTYPTTVGTGTPTYVRKAAPILTVTP